MKRKAGLIVLGALALAVGSVVLNDEPAPAEPLVIGSASPPPVSATDGERVASGDLSLSTTSLAELAAHGRLVFADDFDDPALDASKWVTCYWWDYDGCTNPGNENLQWYLPSGVTLEDGLLRLVAEEQSVDASDGNTYRYTSGIVTTGRDVSDTEVEPRFAFRYGYVEVRAKPPAGAGLWPTIWLLPITHDSKPEIDIMEMRGDEPFTNRLHLHFRDGDGESDQVGSHWEGPDLTEEFHTYAVDWQPDSVTWFVDGEQVWKVRDHVPQEPLYLIANLAVGGEFPGSPNATTEFPSVFEIDWVRVWQ